MMNRLFLLYIISFGLIFYRLVHQLVHYDYNQLNLVVQTNKFPKGLKVFLIIMGLSVFVWLPETLLNTIHNRPSALIGMQSTEPTYILDLALIAPACFIAAYQVKRKQAFGIVLSVMMLTLLGTIGIIVIIQSITQNYFGIEVGMTEMIAFVFSFVILSFVALFYLVRLLKLTKLKQ